MLVLAADGILTSSRDMIDVVRCPVPELRLHALSEQFLDDPRTCTSTGFSACFCDVCAESLRMGVCFQEC